MINFRYHVVSIIGIFIALAVGVVLGAGPLQRSINAGMNPSSSQAASDPVLSACGRRRAQRRVDLHRPQRGGPAPPLPRRQQPRLPQHPFRSYSSGCPHPAGSRPGGQGIVALALGSSMRSS